MEKLQYCKVREVKSPCRAHPFDAGIDFFVPTNLDVATFRAKCEVTKDFVEIVEENGIVKKMILKPGQSVLIPSGIKVKVPENMMLQFTNKSGIASKRHLIVGANVVDTFYEGECHINLHNVGTTEQTIEAGDKIVQGILIPVACYETEDLGNAETLYHNQDSTRGEGGFGSSGTK